MPVAIGSVGFARLADEKDNTAVVRSRVPTHAHMAEAEKAGYDLTLYHSTQKAHQATSGKTKQTTRERLEEEYADAKRALARFMAGLRSKAQAQSENAQQKVADLVEEAQESNYNALDATDDQRNCWQQVLALAEQGWLLTAKQTPLGESTKSN